MEAHVHSPNKWQVFPPMQHLKDMARREGLWNLFIPPAMAKEIRQLDDLSEEEKIALCGPGLTNVEYSFVAERMGRCLWASEVFNCSAPDTGNMEILARSAIHCLSSASPIHGRQIRDRCPKEDMACAVAEGRNTFLLCHDRKARGLFRCDQYPSKNPAVPVTCKAVVEVVKNYTTGQWLHIIREEMVDQWSYASQCPALYLHGQDRCATTHPSTTVYDSHSHGSSRSRHCPSHSSVFDRGMWRRCPCSEGDACVWL